MTNSFEWLVLRWPDVAVPAAVFFSALMASLWIRRIVYKAFEAWVNRTGGEERQILLQATRRASVLWCLIISAYLGLLVSMIPEGWKNPLGDVLLSLFLISLTFSAFQVAERIISILGDRLKVPQPGMRVGRTIFRVTILILAAMVLLDIWGLSMSPLLLLIGATALAGALALRNIMPNWAAWFQLASSGQIKVGDYIKLETGEEGYVTGMGWGYAQIKAVDETLILIPNRKLMESTIVNYGRPLKQARESFHFYTRLNLTELTGLKAKDLKELVQVMKTSSDAIIYYHTHHFLELHQYLTPEPASDFALWVTDSLGEEALGENLASIDPFEFPALRMLKERLVNAIEAYLAKEPELRQAAEGREFHFMKAVSFIMPTPYMAHDLREFVESLRKLSVSSLYFHIFESRLRLGKGLNDFSIWLQDSLEETELAEKVAQLDPYTYTLEGLRSTLIQLIEKRIK